MHKQALLGHVGTLIVDVEDKEAYGLWQAWQSSRLWHQLTVPQDRTVDVLICIFDVEQHPLDIVVHQTLMSTGESQLGRREINRRIKSRFGKFVHFGRTAGCGSLQRRSTASKKESSML